MLYRYVDTNYLPTSEAESDLCHGRRMKLTPTENPRELGRCPKSHWVANARSDTGSEHGEAHEGWTI
jgi:hypothetical protein